MKLNPGGAAQRAAQFSTSKAAAKARLGLPVVIAALMATGSAGAILSSAGVTTPVIPAAASVIRAGGIVTAANPLPTAAPAIAAPPVTTPAPPPPAPPNVRGAVPVGKGMWIWLPEKTEGGDPAAIVARAQKVGLTHLYVRTGSSKMGFHGADFLNTLLPAAHDAGIRIYGWDFPYLHDPAADVARAVQAIKHTTPDGHRIDGFAADVELKSMGVNITPETASWYGDNLRVAVGDAYPLIAVVPRPSPALVNYPYAQLTRGFDAIAPMVYWLNRDPLSTTTMAMQVLGQLGKPVIPIGQAYDGFAEGGPPGVPDRGEIHQFFETAAAHGAPGVSFWSWQHANDEAWQAITDAALFQLPAEPEAQFRADQVRAYQVLLSTLGFHAPMTSVWDQQTVGALATFQRAARIPATGKLDQLTRRLLLHPVAPPVK
ncbi:MAG TPA: peptidoglycan-binding domain-containing protein [Acidimicrobiales bacterium]|nr:peptidoglycan-binding domain-containing protein [Acidimicrobiales bacterium]